MSVCLAARLSVCLSIYLWLVDWTVDKYQSIFHWHNNMKLKWMAVSGHLENWIHLPGFCANSILICLCISGLLEISPVERGVVTLFGVRSGLFIAMNSKGKLYGSVSIISVCVPMFFPEISQTINKMCQNSLLQYNKAGSFCRLMF